MVLTDPSLIQLQEDFLQSKKFIYSQKSEYERQKEMSSAQTSIKKSAKMPKSDWKEISIILEKPYTASSDVGFSSTAN